MERDPRFPDRPEHADFEVLVQIVTEVLSQRIDTAEDSNAEFEKVLAETIDPASASYMALQRALRSFGLASPQEIVTRMDDLFRGCSLYLEGLIAGVEFERRRAAGE